MFVREFEAEGREGTVPGDTSESLRSTLEKHVLAECDLWNVAKECRA